MCHTIGLIPDIGALNYCFSKLKVVMASNYYADFFTEVLLVSDLYIQIRVTLFGRGSTEPHWQTIPEGLKQTFLNQHGTGGWIS